MERDELNNLGKEELMERIKAKYADDIKGLKGAGYLFLVILAYNLIDHWRGGGSELSYCAFPAVVVLWCFLEVWWTTRMMKCDDAHSLIKVHDNYIKYHKIEHGLGIALWGAFAYSLYKQSLESTQPYATVMFVVVWGALFCFIMWRFYKLSKYDSYPEIARLRKLAN